MKAVSSFDEQPGSHLVIVNSNGVVRTINGRREETKASGLLTAQFGLLSPLYRVANVYILI